MKRGVFYILCIGIFLTAPGCSVKKKNTETIKDLAFEVVSREDVPKELEKNMQKEGMKSFRLTYMDDGKLYIARGYGERKTSGYGVEVIKCREKKETIHMQTRLVGPKKEEKAVCVKTNPHVVICIDGTEKDVVFE